MSKLCCGKRRRRSHGVTHRIVKKSQNCSMTSPKLRQGLPDLESRTGPFLKARAAAIPLQKTLPTLIAWELAVLDVPPLLDGPRSGEEATKWRQGQSERVARLKLLSSLLEIVFPSDRDPPSIGILGNYPFAAASF